MALKQRPSFNNLHHIGLIQNGFLTFTKYTGEQDGAPRESLDVLPMFTLVTGFYIQFKNIQVVWTGYVKYAI